MKALTGGQAAAEALRQIEPGVFAVYPITPQTPIVEGYAKFVAQGKTRTEYVCVESEHSALSLAIGAQAAGVRATTATASQGLALMHEMLHIASGLRLPVVINVASRALAAPINIHCDHSDVFSARDSGWIQLFAENPQEVYDLNLIALKVAENPKVLLPAMVIQDGFITSHCLEGVRTLEDAAVKQLVGDYRPAFSLLNFDQPVTIGPLALPDSQMEIKQSQMAAFDNALEVFDTVSDDFFRLTKRKYQPCEGYNLEKAEIAIVAVGSTAGTIRHFIDHHCENPEKIGLLKISLFRPFPYRLVSELLSTVKQVVVLERVPLLGSVGPLTLEVNSALYAAENLPTVSSFVYGLGGRDFGPEDLQEIIDST
ncbi:pyruvate ferredoxin oxidoreductase [Candidatus Parcubacteria bacterium]|nr:pyruvate ferredoxin oxidoreductase [Candidatus Parcubacteria bacterium]